jgi:integration host factor subunit alpha
MALTKAELADLLFENVGLNKREAKDMVESFYEEVRNALQNNEGVKLSGFGNFQLREKPQRPGKKPKNRRRNSYYRTSCCNISCQPETKNLG